MNRKCITFGHQTLNPRWKRSWTSNLEKKVEDDEKYHLQQECQRECQGEWRIAAMKDNAHDICTRMKDIVHDTCMRMKEREREWRKRRRRPNILNHNFSPFWPLKKIFNLLNACPHKFNKIILTLWRHSCMLEQLRYQLFNHHFPYSN